MRHCDAGVQAPPLFARFVRGTAHGLASLLDYVQGDVGDQRERPGRARDCPGDHRLRGPRHRQPVSAGCGSTPGCRRCIGAKWASAAVAMRVLHVGAQNGIHARLIAWALRAEPRQHVFVNAQGQGRLKSTHGRADAGWPRLGGGRVGRGCGVRLRVHVSSPETEANARAIFERDTFQRYTESFREIKTNSGTALVPRAARWFMAKRVRQARRGAGPALSPAARPPARYAGASAGDTMVDDVDRPSRPARRSRAGRATQRHLGVTVRDEWQRIAYASGGFLWGMV